MERRILGDKKNRNYDETLVDKVNKQFAKEEKQSRKANKSVKEEPDSKTIDLPGNWKIYDPNREQFTHPKEEKTVKGWFDYFEKDEFNKKGIFLASMSSYYQMFKNLYHDINDRTGGPRLRSGERLIALKDDLAYGSKNLLISSTEIKIDVPDSWFNSNVDIKHFSKCNNGTIKKDYDNLRLIESKALTHFVKQPGGEDFIKKLFDTEDSIEMIISVFKKFWGDMLSEEIMIITPLVPPNNIHSFYGYFSRSDNFYIGCDLSISEHKGYCRGINYDWKDDDEIS